MKKTMPEVVAMQGAVINDPREDFKKICFVEDSGIGKEVEEICVKYLHMRKRLIPYITTLMEAAHEKGTPIIRPLFYDFPQDKECWEDN